MWKQWKTFCAVFLCVASSLSAYCWNNCGYGDYRGYGSYGGCCGYGDYDWGVPPAWDSWATYDPRYCPGRWSITGYGGIMPSKYTIRGPNYFFAPAPAPFAPFKTRLISFHNQYKLPWTAGGEIGYMVRERAELFLDFSYASALAKNYSFIGPLGTTIKEKFSLYKSMGYYLGYRQYFTNISWEGLTPFLGFKMGLLYRYKAVGHDVIPTLGGGSTDFFATNFKGSWVGSCGPQWGIAWDYCPWWSLVFKVEVLVTGDWPTNTLFTPAPGPIIRLGNTGPVIHVPLTLGLKCTY